MAICFCCCPIYRCALWFCAIEILVSFYLWFTMLDFVVKTFSVL